MVCDEVNLVSFVGLAPALASAAERAGLSDLLGERVRIDPAAVKVRSAAANPTRKLTSIIAEMLCCAACIDDLDDLNVIRSGGMTRLFTGEDAASTLGQFLREVTHGQTLQLASVTIPAR